MRVHSIQFTIMGIFILIFFAVACQTLKKPALLEKIAIVEQQSDFIFTDRKNQADTTIKNKIPETTDRKKVVTISKNKKGKIIRTVFSGAVLVREIFKKQGIETIKLTISGNAKIQHDNVTIQASKMTILNNRIGKLRGNIRITDHQSGVKLFSKSAVYNRDKQFVSLDGNPYMLVYSKLKGSKKKQPPALVSCNKMLRDLNKKESKLQGDVRIHQDSWTFIGERGIYKDGSDKIILKYNPYIFGINQFLTGKNLVYTISKKQAKLDNNIIYLSTSSGILETKTNTEKKITLEEFGRQGGKFQKQKRKPSVRGKQLSILTSTEIRFIQESEDKESLAIVKGNVLLTRPGLKVKANELKAVGRSFHTLYTQTGVEIFDYERDLHARAGVLDYKIKKRFFRMEREPVLQFYKKGTEIVESTLKAAIIERDFDKNNMIARGNVHLIREGFEAIGERARYFEEDGFILIEGNPGIVSQDNIIRSEKILYYIKNKKIFLYNRIRGYLGFGNHQYGS